MSQRGSVPRGGLLHVPAFEAELFLDVIAVYLLCVGDRRMEEVRKRAKRR